MREPLRGEVPRGGGQVPLPERADQSAVPEGGCPGPDRLPRPSCSCRPAGAQAPQLSQARGGGGRWPCTRSLLTPIAALRGQHLPAPGGGGRARGRVGEERGAHAGRPVSWERWHQVWLEVHGTSGLVLCTLCPAPSHLPSHLPSWVTTPASAVCPPAECSPFWHRPPGQGRPCSCRAQPAQTTPASDAAASLGCPQVTALLPDQLQS